MSDDPKFMIVVRFPPGLKASLRKLCEVSDRSFSWVGKQALLRLFRELEEGVVLASDIHHRVISSNGQSGPVQFRFEPGLTSWVGRLTNRTGKPTSEILRYAVVRYLGNRVRLVQGMEEYADPLTEEGPRMPPT